MTVVGVMACVITLIARNRVQITFGWRLRAVGVSLGIRMRCRV